MNWVFQGQLHFAFPQRTIEEEFALVIGHEDGFLEILFCLFKLFEFEVALAS